MTRAFGIDNRVARLNNIVFWSDVNRKWPGPHLLSKAVRRIIYPIKKCCVRARKSFYSLGQSILRSMPPTSPEDRVEDVTQLDEIEHQEVVLNGPSVSSRLDYAKDMYRISLRKTFDDVDLVQSLILDIERWENGGYETPIVCIYRK